jgi:hypothetical protein
MTNVSQERLKGDTAQIEEYMSKRTPIRLNQTSEVVFDTRTGIVVFDYAETEIGDLITNGDAAYVVFAVNNLPYHLSELKRLQAIEAERDRYKAALKWYADDDNWERTTLRQGTEWLEPGPANSDEGERARKALEGAEPHVPTE